ncbi:mucin-3A-like [Ornithodoros turicata]|uniref:mucin-3A-like n=1 Tax=Ornithodoros turicata TaxID=34597 RepID=UPI0031395C9C
MSPKKRSSSKDMFLKTSEPIRNAICLYIPLLLLISACMPLFFIIIPRSKAFRNVAEITTVVYGTAQDDTKLDHEGISIPLRSHGLFERESVRHKGKSVNTSRIRSSHTVAKSLPSIIPTVHQGDKEPVHRPSHSSRRHQRHRWNKTPRATTTTITSMRNLHRHAKVISRRRGRSSSFPNTTIRLAVPGSTVREHVTVSTSYEGINTTQLLIFDNTSTALSAGRSSNSVTGSYDISMSDGIIKTISSTTALKDMMTVDSISIGEFHIVPLSAEVSDDSVQTNSSATRAMSSPEGVTAEESSRHTPELATGQAVRATEDLNNSQNWVDRSPARVSGDAFRFDKDPVTDTKLNISSSTQAVIGDEGHFGRSTPLTNLSERSPMTILYESEWNYTANTGSHAGEQHKTLLGRHPRENLRDALPVSSGTSFINSTNTSGAEDVTRTISLPSPSLFSVSRLATSQLTNHPPVPNPPASSTIPNRPTAPLNLTLAELYNWTTAASEGNATRSESEENVIKSFSANIFDGTDWTSSSRISSTNQSSCQSNCVSFSPSSISRSASSASLLSTFRASPSTSQTASPLLGNASIGLRSQSALYAAFSFATSEATSPASLQHRTFPSTSTMTATTSPSGETQGRSERFPALETSREIAYSDTTTMYATSASQYLRQGASTTDRSSTTKAVEKKRDIPLGIPLNNTNDVAGNNTGDDHGVRFMQFNGTKDANTSDGHYNYYYYYDDDNHTHHNDTVYYYIDSDGADADALRTDLDGYSQEASRSDASSSSPRSPTHGVVDTASHVEAKSSSVQRKVSIAADASSSVSQNLFRKLKDSTGGPNDTTLSSAPPRSTHAPPPGKSSLTSSQSTVASMTTDYSSAPGGDISVSSLTTQTFRSVMLYTSTLSTQVLTNTPPSISQQKKMEVVTSTSSVPPSSPRGSVHSATETMSSARLKTAAVEGTRHKTLLQGPRINLVPQSTRGPVPQRSGRHTSTAFERNGELARRGQQTMAVSERERTLVTAIPVELTPQGHTSFKPQGRALPQAPSLFCTLPSTYKGPYPVHLCDRILIKDLILFDQRHVKLSVRSYDVHLSLKRLRESVSFKILGLLASNTIEAFRMQNPSRDNFVDALERLLLRITLDGLCFDLDAVTRASLADYRHILKDIRVKLYDKLLCTVFSYMARVKLPSKHLISLLRLFNTSIIHQDYRLISPMEATVPNPLRRNESTKFSLTAALRMSVEIRGPSRRKSICLPLSLRGTQYDLLLPKESRDIGAIARFVKTPVSADAICTRYKHWPRVYDNATGSWYISEGTKWIGFDDAASLKRKVPALLERFRPDCVFLDDVHLDDPNGRCASGAFPQTTAVLGIFNETLRSMKSYSPWNKFA